jgi:GTP-binding nuclear protein Ran
MPKKVVLVGDSGVGKTVTTKHAFVSQDFSHVPAFELRRRYPEHNPTVGVEVHELSVYVDNALKELQIWDCGGDERFRGLADAYYLDADACLVVGPNRDKWKREFQNVAPKASVLCFATPTPKMFQELAKLV